MHKDCVITYCLFIQSFCFYKQRNLSEIANNSLKKFTSNFRFQWWDFLYCFLMLLSSPNMFQKVPQMSETYLPGQHSCPWRVRVGMGTKKGKKTAMAMWCIPPPLCAFVSHCNTYKGAELWLCSWACHSGLIWNGSNWNGISSKGRCCSISEQIPLDIIFSWKLEVMRKTISE